MIFLLYWSFLKIGFTSFGGASMIPLIRSEMLLHGWMTQAEVTDIVAIAEMTPGPLGLNCATFAGMRAAGLPGALAANLGVLTPSLTTSIAAAVFFARFRKSRVMTRALIGIRPSVIGMVLGVCATMSISTYCLTASSFGSVDPVAVGIGCLALFLLRKIRLSIPKVIAVCAVLGMAVKLL